MPENDDQNDDNAAVNPPHNRAVREDPDVEQARLFRYHKANQTLEHFYALYPYRRPKQRSSDESKPRGRDGR